MPRLCLWFPGEKPESRNKNLTRVCTPGTASYPRSHHHGDGRATRIRTNLFLNVTGRGEPGWGPGSPGLCGCGPRAGAWPVAPHLPQAAQRPGFGNSPRTPCPRDAAGGGGRCVAKPSCNWWQSRSGSPCSACPSPGGGAAGLHLPGGERRGRQGPAGPAGCKCYRRGRGRRGGGVGGGRPGAVARGLARRRRC